MSCQRANGRKVRRGGKSSRLLNRSPHKFLAARHLHWKAVKRVREQGPGDRSTGRASGTRSSTTLPSPLARLTEENRPHYRRAHARRYIPRPFLGHAARCQQPFLVWGRLSKASGTGDKPCCYCFPMIVPQQPPVLRTRTIGRMTFVRSRRSFRPNVRATRSRGVPLATGTNPRRIGIVSATTLLSSITSH